MSRPTIQVEVTEQQANLLLLALEMLDGDLCAAVDDSGSLEIVRELWENVFDAGVEMGWAATAEVDNESR